MVPGSIPGGRTFEKRRNPPMAHLMYGYVRLCAAMYGYVGLCTAMLGQHRPLPLPDFAPEAPWAGTLLASAGRSFVGHPMAL